MDPQQLDASIRAVAHCRTTFIPESFTPQAKISARLFYFRAFELVACLAIFLILQD
jgi:hypothetical protein